MITFLLRLQFCCLALLQGPTDTAVSHQRRGRRRRDHRGSVTIEQVIWAGAVIAIVGIVVAAITAYVKSKSGDIS